MTDPIMDLTEIDLSDLNFDLDLNTRPHTLPPLNLNICLRTPPPSPLNITGFLGTNSLFNSTPKPMWSLPHSQPRMLDCNSTMSSTCYWKASCTTTTTRSSILPNPINPNLVCVTILATERTSWEAKTSRYLHHTDGRTIVIIPVEGKRKSKYAG